MAETVDLAEMIAFSRKVLLQPRVVEGACRRRWFSVLLADKAQVSVEPNRFLEVFDSAVKPILSAATHCRVSVALEQLPELERVAASATDTYRARIARSLLKKWSSAGATPAAWLEAFTTKVKSPVKEHLTSGVVCTKPDEFTTHFTFSVPAGDVEVNLASDVINTPLFWWWLLCGDLGASTVFLVDPGIVGAPSFWKRTMDPTNCTAKPAYWSRFALRETARSTRVAMSINYSLRLTTYAASGTIERLYRTAVESAIISEGRAKADAADAKYLFRT